MWVNAAAERNAKIWRGYTACMSEIAEDDGVFRAATLLVVAHGNPMGQYLAIGRDRQQTGPAGVVDKTHDLAAGRGFPDANKVTGEPAAARPFAVACRHHFP